MKASIIVVLVALGTTKTHHLSTQAIVSKYATPSSSYAGHVYTRTYSAPTTVYTKTYSAPTIYTEKTYSTPIVTKTLTKTVSAPVFTDSSVLTHSSPTIITHSVPAVAHNIPTFVEGYSNPTIVQQHPHSTVISQTTYSNPAVNAHHPEIDIRTSYAAPSVINQQPSYASPGSTIVSRTNFANPSVITSDGSETIISGPSGTIKTKSASVPYTSYSGSHSSHLVNSPYPYEGQYVHNQNNFDGGSYRNQISW